MVELEAFGREDFDRLIGWVESEEMLMQWAGPLFSWPLSHAQLASYLKSAEGREPARAIYRAVRIDTARKPASGDDVVGHVELNAIDRRNRSATLSRVLVRPDLRGKGIGGEMVHRLLEIAFDEMRLHRVDLFVFDYNAAAVRCYEKLGFAREGVLRDYRRLGDRYLTTVVMAILEDQWGRAG
jgi:RimJ/RimL family protein N-acetyltransferase